MSITKRTRRIGGLAALAFSGSVLLAACDGQASYCDTLYTGVEQLNNTIDDLESQQGNFPEDSVQYDLLEVKITGLEALRDAKQDEINRSCNTLN